MQKEIFEQPAVIGDTLQALIKPGHPDDPPARIAVRARRHRQDHVARLRHRASCRADREILARNPARHPGRGRHRLGVPLPRAAMPRDGAAIGISQSGETSDNARRAAYIAARPGRRSSPSSQPESTIAREPTWSCRPSPVPRSGVASTKAFTTQLAVLAAFTIAIARARGTIDAAGGGRLAGQLAEVPSRASEVLHHDESIQEIAASNRARHCDGPLSRPRHLLPAGASKAR